MGPDGKPIAARKKAMRRKNRRNLARRFANSEIEALTGTLNQALGLGHQSHREDTVLITEIASQVGQKRLARAFLGLHNHLLANKGADYLTRLPSLAQNR